MKRFMTLAALVASSFLAAPLMADVTLTQGNSILTYGTTLNFDEAGGPSGAAPQDSWAGIGIANFAAGTGDSFVADWATDAGAPWIGENLSNLGSFGHFINFAQPLTELSFEAWSPDGAPTPFGGGLSIGVYSDGTELINPFVDGSTTPAWGGLGDQGYTIVATGGMTFDEIRIIADNSYIDNISFNAVPEPSSLVLFGMTAMLGLATLRRRS